MKRLRSNATWCSLDLRRDNQVVRRGSCGPSRVRLYAVPFWSIDSAQVLLDALCADAWRAMVCSTHDLCMPAGLTYSTKSAPELPVSLSGCAEFSAARNQASCCAATDEYPAASLICLKTGSECPPLFMIHGLGGTFTELVHLAQLIRHRGPIYGFQAEWQDGMAAPLRTVEAMAKYYADAVRAVQPHGPYYICGYSFGGIVAVELARHLQSRRQTIALLALIESYGRPQTWPLKARLDAWRCKWEFRISKLRRQPRRTLISYVSKALRPLRAMQARLLAAMVVGAADAPNSNGRLYSDPRPKGYVAETLARDSYEPRFYPGKIVFLKPEITNYGFPPDPTCIWRPLAQELEVHRVPGDHQTLIDQHAPGIAALLSRILVAKCGCS